MKQITLRYLLFVVIVMTWSVAAVGFTQAGSIEPQMVNVPSAICTWNSSATGNWNDPTKWSGCAGGVPGAADTAIISSGLITLTSNVTLGTLTFSGGTIQGNSNLVVTNMTWIGGTWKDSGTTTVNGTLDMSNSSVTLDHRTLINAGTATLGGSSVYLIMYNGAVFNNQASMQFSHTSTGQITYSTGSGTFTNSGYITKTFASSGFTYIYVPFNNSGSMTANNGIFYLAPAVATTSNNSGSFNIASSALLQMAGNGTVNFNAGSGLVGAGTVNFSSGTTTFNVGSTYAISNTQVIGGVADLSATSAVTFGNVTTVGVAPHLIVEQRLRLV